MGGSDEESDEGGSSQRSRSPRSPSAESSRQCAREQSSSRETEVSRSSENKLIRQLQRENAALRGQVSELVNQLREMTKEMADLRGLLTQQLSQDTQTKKKAQPKKRQADEVPEIEEMEVTPPTQTTSENSNPQDPPNKKRRAQEKPAEVAERSPQPETAETEKTTPRIPPIVLRQKDKWSEISRRLTERRISYSKAKLTGEGIQLQPSTPESFRAATKVLAELKYEFHTYALPDERQLRVVVRGLPDGLDLQEVKQDLVEQGFQPESLFRMTSRRTRQAMPLVLVKLPQDQEEVLKVTRCCSLVVKVERQRNNPQVTQCHRCQRFGHAQGKCTAQPKCVKCGQAHFSHECKKSREVPAKCANCQGAHPASYRGCPSCPKAATALRKPANPPQPAEQKQKASQQARQGPVPRSFAEAARVSKTAAKPKRGGETTVSPASLTAALAQMQTVFSAMSTFFANLPASMTG